MRNRFGIAVLATVAGMVAATAAPVGAFPGQNGKIAFTHLVGGRFEVWVMNADGSAATALSTSGFNEFEPAAPPGGSLL